MLIHILLQQVAPNIFLLTHAIFIESWKKDICIFTMLCYFWLLDDIQLIYPLVISDLFVFFIGYNLDAHNPRTPHSHHNSWHTWYFCQEGQTIVENKTANIIQETRKLNIRRKGAGPNTQGEAGHKKSTWPWNSVEGISRRKVANMCH